MRVLLWDAVKSAQVALGLIPEVLDAVVVVSLVNEELRVDPEVPKARRIEHIVGVQRVRVDDGCWRNLALQNRLQRTLPDVRKTLA